MVQSVGIVARSAGWKAGATAGWKTCAKEWRRVEKLKSCAIYSMRRCMQAKDPDPGLERTRYALRAAGVKPESPNNLRSGIHSRGYLPHVKREGASYFVTFRLADSLPREVLLDFEREKAKRLRRLQHFKSCGETINDSEEEIARTLATRLNAILTGAWALVICASQRLPISF